ncbi:MAG TPA: glycoside hydrolase family 2 TIM barrel-domain containing protein [Terriglobia bacterium]|nr:glycoside hydrolase family 2 TIM barrel-domain containing protein [Terriglobia bacterium]
MAPTPPAGSRSRVDLAGTWERHVHGKLVDVIPVPSSQRPLGFYHLKREFLLPALTGQQRAIVHFEAITYHGRVFVNGAELGTMGPYIPYEFDITAQAKEGKNQIDVAIADLHPDTTGAGKDELALGVNPGWEAYGGIIRDVYVEVRPAAFIDNLRLAYQLTSGYTQISCQARVFVFSSVAAAGHLEVGLWKGETEVARAERAVDVTAGATEAEVSFTVVAPDLWSLEEPNLYELRAGLKTEEGEDSWKCRTGFRDVAIRGNQFELNGRRLLLNGVARHDMWKDQGFTLTRAQMAQDMRMIKALGANFVRLVHYPHHRHIVELADELGLLVTEEPGYWGMDFRTMPRTMIELGYRIMEGTIRRDWNSPAVFAWLLGNECALTVEYLKEGKERCRKLDPIARPVSFANDRNKEIAKPIFEQSGMDFFDQHVYTFDIETFRKEAEYFGPSRPFTVTEWGARQWGQSQMVMEQMVDLIMDLEAEGKMAGSAFWEWADMRQYGRVEIATLNGVLLEGVVTEARDPRPDVYLELARLFEGYRAAGPASTQPTVLPLKWSPSGPGASFQPIDLQALVESAEGAKAWAELETRLAKYWPRAAMAEDQWNRTGQRFTLWQGSDLLIAGVPFRLPLAGGTVRPLVLMPDQPVTIPIDLECERLQVLGQVTFPAGYPVQGKRGETVATYHLRYSGGRERQIPVRNGIEVAQANLIHEATRIDPIATEAQPALKYVKDIVREQYQVLLWTLPLERGKVESLRCEMQGGAPPLAIFAITTEG